MSAPKITWGIGMTLTAPDGQSTVYFQPGDDESRFQDEYEELEQYLGHDQALWELWNTYSDIAQPIEPAGAAA